jgi:hypothetical protein
MSNQNTLTTVRSAPGTLVTIDGDAACEYRLGFLRAVAHLGLDATHGARLAESLTNRSFAACGPADLRPVLDQLRVITQRLQPSKSAQRQACGE